MPPLLADFTHARPCKPFCEKYLTLPQFAPVVRFLAHEPLIFEVFSFGKVQIITSFAQKKRPCLDAFVCLYMQLLYMVDYIRIAPIKILYNSKA